MRGVDLGYLLFYRFILFSILISRCFLRNHYAAFGYFIRPLPLSSFASLSLYHVIILVAMALAMAVSASLD